MRVEREPVGVLMPFEPPGVIPFVDQRLIRDAVNRSTLNHTASENGPVNLNRCCSGNSTLSPESGPWKYRAYLPGRRP